MILPNKNVLSHVVAERGVTLFHWDAVCVLIAHQFIYTIYST